MSRGLERRLERLEEHNGGITALVVLDRPDETYDEAVARYVKERPEHRDAGRFVVVDTGIYR